MTTTSTPAALTLAGLCLATAAQAQQPQLAPPTVYQLADAQNAGPTEANGGPGAEQITVTRVTNQGAEYLVAVWMSSQVSRADGPYQCKCTSFRMDPLLGPTKVADQVQITANNGNRPCNHPKLATNGADILWTYATNDPNQNNVQTYVQGLDHMCNVTTQRLIISRNNGGNDGAPDIAFNGVRDGQSYWVAGYLENNQRSRAVGLTTRGTGGGLAITKHYNETIVDPANIGRPSLVPMGLNRSLFCSTNGDNRPPELGIRCAMIDSMTGDIVWSELIAASQPNANPPIYFNQPQLALGDNGRVFLQVERSNGRGNNGGNRRRGATVTYLYTLTPDETGAHMTAEVSNIGAHQVHATACSGTYGPHGETHVAVYDASYTGSGIAVAQLAKYDVLDRSISTVGPQRALGSQAADSGYLANIYGQNPNTQGRDFMRCLGDVPNPGFGVANGFRPEVESFFVFPFSGAVPGDAKNSAFISFLPGSVPVAPPPVQHNLSVSIVGDGVGSVSSSPTGIENCTRGAACSASFQEGLVVSFTPRADAGSFFVGWSGDCTGNGPCVVRMDGDHQVTATFTKVNPNPNNLVALGVRIGGSGKGSISSSPAGLSCLSSQVQCTANFSPDATVTLTATAESGSTFEGWGGDCAGRSTCAVALDAARFVTAIFTLDATSPSPSPAPSSSAQPTTDPVVSACSTTGANGGAFGPTIVMLGLVALISRRRRS